jgi:hypothetical protein
MIPGGLEQAGSVSRMAACAMMFAMAEKRAWDYKTGGLIADNVIDI